MKTIVIFLSFFFVSSAQGAGTCDHTSAEELSDLVFGQTLAKTCAIYENPVDAAFEPLPPFLKDPERAELRRSQGPAIFEKIKADAILPSAAASALESWINKTIAAGKIAQVSRPVRVFEIKQEKICRELIEKKFAGMRENARTPEIRKDIERDMELSIQSCLRQNYGYANFVTREIILGNATLQRLGESVARFAVLHELCHIQNPAIRGQSFEEVYCDAVAFKWAAALIDKASLEQLRGSFSEKIKPENEFEDLLGLRSHLPVCCPTPTF